jgi:opacity protein-like surface antigen
MLIPAISMIKIMLVLKNTIDKSFGLDMLKITNERSVFVDNIEANGYENIKEGLVMKKLSRDVFIFFFLAVFLLALTVNGTAQETQRNKFYVGVFGGFAMPDDLEVELNREILFNNYYGDLDLDNSGMLGAKLGWIPAWAGGFLAVELEYHHIFNQSYSDNLVSLIGDVVLEEGDVKLDNILFTTLARYPRGRFHPFVGLGAGVSFFNISGRESPPTAWGIFTPRGGSYDDTDTAFAWQFLGGINIDLTKKISGDLSYRYLSAYPNDIGEDTKSLDYHSHIISIGINYHF